MKHHAVTRFRCRFPGFKALMLLPVLAAVALSQAAGRAEAAEVCFRGINISGAEYGVDTAGVYGTNYVYPSEKTVRYFAEKGMNIVRLPFRWERLQPVLGERLDTGELDLLRKAVELIRSYKMKVVLDPHNFGYYHKKRLVTNDLPARAFADFWIRLSIEFANDDDIIFGLMNEPYDIHVTDWLSAANQAIAGIRASGARNLILVPGTHWSGASSWEQEFPVGVNGDVMGNVKDPGDNFAYEVHQYLDEDSSGTHDTCPKAKEAVAGLERLTQWLKRHDARGFLGEFGGSKDKACLAGLTAMVQAMESAPEQWLGWTYWAAGDWWPETEGNNIQPTASGDRPQLAAILDGVGPGDGPSCSTLP